MVSMPQAEQFVNDDLIRLGWLWSNGCSIRGARQKEDCGYPKEEEITWRGGIEWWKSIAVKNHRRTRWMTERTDEWVGQKPSPTYRNVSWRGSEFGLFYLFPNSSAFFPHSGIMGVRREERGAPAKRFEKSTAAVSSSQKRPICGQRSVSKGYTKAAQFL